MSAPTTAAKLEQWPWLRSARFDLAFILGIPAISVLTGLVVSWRPELLWPWPAP